MKHLLKIKCAMALIGLFGLAGLQAAPRDLVPGEDYQVMAPKGSKKPEVLEFFSYGCGACYSMESFVTQFKKNNPAIKLTPVPIDLGHQQWEIYVKAYYLGELLKVLDKSHSRLFHRIHVEKKQITKESALKDFFVDLGVDPEKYDKAEKSFMLSTKIRKSKQLNRKYGIASTPTFIANQRFKLDNSKLATTEMIGEALKQLTRVTP